MVECSITNYVVVGSTPVPVTETPYIAPVLTKKFPDIQANIDYVFTLKRVYDMIRTYSQIHRTGKYSQLSSIIWSVWLDRWMFIYN